MRKSALLYSQATRDMANDRLNNSDRADEYGDASDEKAEAMLLAECAEIIQCECDEAARIERLTRCAS